MEKALPTPLSSKRTSNFARTGLSFSKSTKKKAKKGIKGKRGKELAENEILRPLSYVIIPKGKRLARKVVTKLEKENYEYALARAVDAKKRFDLKKGPQLTSQQPQWIEAEEQEWRDLRKQGPAYQAQKAGKLQRLIKREKKRRIRKERVEREELHRKKYRVHPDDPYHKYLEGYEKKRHRISKSRFMRCVDVPLFKEVLNHNKELIQSSIWEGDLSLKHLSFVRARLLKDELQQFTVVEEALKQGIFNIPGCDDLPIRKVRRKKRPRKSKPDNLEAVEENADKATVSRRGTKTGNERGLFVDKYKPKEGKRQLLKKLRASAFPKHTDHEEYDLKKKRRYTYPPYEANLNLEVPVDHPPMTWAERVGKWLVKIPKSKHPPPNSLPPKAEDGESSLHQKESNTNLKTVSQESLKNKSLDTNEEKTNIDTGEQKWRRKSVIISNEVETNRITRIAKQPNAPTAIQRENETPKTSLKEIPSGSDTSVSATPSKVNEEDTGLPPPEVLAASEEIKARLNIPNNDKARRGNPYANYLSIKIPYELGKKQKFIHDLVNRKTKENSEGIPKWLQKQKLQLQKLQEQAHVLKYDPLQKLHPDDKESDVWTISTTTTTDGYASWRRPPPNDRKNLDEEEDWTETDKTFLWRIVLLLIVIWEASFFVEKQLDNVYYGIFTFQLYRENIWPERPGFFAPLEHYYVVHLQQWLHFLISVICMSIIHKENECVSLLFACSLLFDGLMKVTITAHDAVFLPHVVSWASTGLNIIHLMWKAFVVCFFVAYHFYSADYIRKSREFKHRKTKLHNHEINAKGKKGLEKRKLAWDWMIQHARRTNVRALQKKYPDVLDGDFPPDELPEDVKFSEPKELKLYAQENSLFIGYPYNKLRDMKRYVFGELEKSDYSTEPGEKPTEPEPAPGLTMKKYNEWKKNERRKKYKLNQNQNPANNQNARPQPVVEQTPRKSHIQQRYSLTIGPKLSRSQP